MPRRYRLRLGDGTILMVDQQGLNTWRVDAKAMVQAAGGRWRPLKDLLAMQQAAAKYAAQHQEEANVPSVVLPLVPPPPRDAKLRPPTPSPPPPVVEPSVVEPSVVEPPMVEPLVIDEPAPIPAPADESPEPDVGLAGPDLAVDEGPPIVPADFREEEELAPVSGALTQGAPPEPAIAEAAEPQAWADEPAIFTTDSETASPPAADAVVGEEDEVATELPAPTANDRGWDPEPSQWPDAVEAPVIAASQSPVQALADEPASRKHTSTPSDARSEAYYPYAASEPGFEEDDEFLKPRPIVLDPRFIKAASAFGTFLSRAVEHLGELTGWLREKFGVLRKKASAFREARAARVASLPSPVVPEDPWPAMVAPDPPRLRSLADNVSEPEPEPELVEARPTPIEPPARPISYETPTRLTPVEEMPLIALKPLPEDKVSPLRAVQDGLRRLGTRASAWVGALRRRTEGLVRRYRSAPGPARPIEIADTGPHYEPPREPLKPPPSTSEIPVLRLLKIEEEEEPQDLYEGPRESPFPTLWLWTKRLLWTGVLVGGGFLAFQGWDAWFPKATSLGTTALTEVTRYAETREQKERERRALKESTEQLPHLAPDTIRLVLSHATSGVPDPPEVFQAACNATDRGLAALTPAERQELKALRRELLSALTPAERERVREYDDVRARRMPFAFEDKSALDLFARGARALPDESRERLQLLVGKAVASGLAAAPVPSPSAKVAR